jgi:Spy/CpxP family protein refolding chaperone
MCWLLLVPWALSVDAKPQAEGPPDPAKLERYEKNVRTRVAVGLAEALDLDESGAIKIAQILRRYRERRRPFQDQVRESAQIIKRASEGDSSAAAQVDQAIHRMFEARIQLTGINREMLLELGQGLSPQQRAKMAIFFAKFDSERRLAEAKRQQKTAQPQPPAQP